MICQPHGIQRSSPWSFKQKRLADLLPFANLLRCPMAPCRYRNSQFIQFAEYEIQWLVPVLLCGASRLDMRARERGMWWSNVNGPFVVSSQPQADEVKWGEMGRLPVRTPWGRKQAVLSASGYRWKDRIGVGVHETMRRRWSSLDEVMMSRNFGHGQRRRDRKWCLHLAVLWSSKTICHVTPPAIVVMSVFFGFAAVATAVNDERFRIGNSHFEEVGGFWWVWGFAEILRWNTKTFRAGPMDECRGRELVLDRNRFGVCGDGSHFVTLKRSDDNDSDTRTKGLVVLKQVWMYLETSYLFEKKIDGAKVWEIAFPYILPSQAVSGASSPLAYLTFLQEFN